MELASANSKTLSIGREKVLIDCGNPRYAASKVPSQVGPLIGQRSRRLVNFSIAENRASKSIDYSAPELDEPEIAPAEDPNGKKTAFVDEVDEISAPDDWTEMEQATFDGREPLAFETNVSGRMLATWGTGYQGGQQQCFQTPGEKLGTNYQIKPYYYPQDDRQTVASEDTFLSSANTEILQKKCTLIQEELKKQTDLRASLERKLDLLRS